MPQPFRTTAADLRLDRTRRGDLGAADPALRDIEFGGQFAHVDAAARIALGPLARVIVR